MRSKLVEKIVSKRMAKRGIRQDDINFFLSAWREMDNSNERINWQHIQPVTADTVACIPEPKSKAYQRLHTLGVAHMDKCAIVKLNGGRSTTMGGQVPKCMVKAKDNKSFLDITMGQIMAANDRNHVEIPLILMNSFFTDHITEKIVGRTPLIIMNFIQNEYPRIREGNFMPLDTGCDDDWCPAGHGDFYTSLAGSGLMDGLLDLGLRYIFISNIDNLSAEISPVILGQMVDGHHDFMMEVTRKTSDDVKGGAPVSMNGQLSLLEIAQVPDEHLHDFQDIDRFCYFNTNNLWVDLFALKQIMARNELNLPIIQNKKTISGVKIIQIETAMGAALQSFKKPGLIEVPRSRFAPVKKLSDLAALQSDAYVMNADYQIRENPQWSAELSVNKA
jgi:UTP--glucose-1-phosphate uridylyltransferase